MKLLRKVIRNLILELNIPKHSLDKRKTFGYFRKPKHDKDLDIPFKDLPRAWKENSGEYEWFPGYGFQHKEENWWVPNTQLPGFDKLGLNVSSFVWAYEPVVGLNPAREKRKTGKEIKRKFSKSYEQNREFFDSLTYVHWLFATKFIEHAKRMIFNPRSKNEVSVGWYDKPPFKAGNSKIGLILSGRPTLVSNLNMQSGFASSDEDAFASNNPDQFIPSFFMGRGGHREKSSGINKYPHADVIDWDAIVYDENDVDPKKIDALRSGKSNNEALIDNFKVSGIIIANDISDAEYEAIIELASAANIKLYDTSGDEL
jgi:hypothetical protein